jgi:phage shock protein A
MEGTMSIKNATIKLSLILMMSLGSSAFAMNRESAKLLNQAARDAQTELSAIKKEYALQIKERMKKDRELAIELESSPTVDSPPTTLQASSRIF